MDQVFLKISPLGFVWETQDPFLYCVHHRDDYPEGNEVLGPKETLEGRLLGEDFDERNAWKMYHGKTVPGFPEHPHRGFETVTVVLEGYIDHFDSAGASGRYGDGDVQWMTAGSGLQHAEMFPLIKANERNPLHLFQIWLNLPKKNKFVAPHYKMLWNEEIPKIKKKDEFGKISEIILIAGEFEGEMSAAPAPDSWASEPEHKLSIWVVKMEAHAKLTIENTSATLNRSLYLYKGSELMVNASVLKVNHSGQLKPLERIDIQNGSEASEWLLLQGEPINEPVVQYGPFVMNTEQEIHEAYSDYHKTRFGGWPWERPDPVHSRETPRFAKYANGVKHFPK
ncbi:pirin family protein [Fusibacter ferrireducens]|uniref:Pirin family protein n=1 Tax=Fusibacter ferrireducens TaxID=2785058 RepID=A0ABR9ZSU4_9FIRM|nr:pirin family protein [Fusibacter ferrireducens]MBF4693515.1 pirin family protein [Fusibacter ferrireducens]